SAASRAMGCKLQWEKCWEVAGELTERLEVFTSRQDLTPLGAIQHSEPGPEGAQFPVVIPISLFLPSPPVPMRCSRPKDVANAHIDVGNNTLLNTRLRYTCNPGYKRKAGTSSLIQCILRDDSTKPDWTHTTLQCIRKPSLGSWDGMGSGEVGYLYKQCGTTDTSLTSSPSPAATPVPPAPDGTPPETVPPLQTSTLAEASRPPEMLPPLQTSTVGEETAPGSSLGTTTLPATPTEHAAGQTTSLGKITHQRVVEPTSKGSSTSAHCFPSLQTPF
uniref:Sushi domain-containing protein n=1 Tax=Strigops habroptila TaxID=2489341 RepID=A0A672TE86_STRHB